MINTTVNRMHTGTFCVPIIIIIIVFEYQSITVYIQ